MNKFKENFLNFWELTLEMTRNDIKARYKNAFFGFLWIFLNPLLQMLIIGFIFQNFIKIISANYFIFLFIGLLVWNFFSSSLLKATPSFVFERNLIQKSKFPKSTIPLSIIFSNFFHFIISLFLLIIFLFFTNQLSLFSSLDKMGFFFGSLAWIFTFTVSFSFLTSSLNVKYRDINFFVQALIILWFYATPIIYSLQILPKEYLSFFQLNPLVYPLEMLRFSLISSLLPEAKILLTNILISLLISVLGIFIFRKEGKNFSDWL
jgi:lipopolysaccharide transport system permease protein